MPRQTHVAAIALAVASLVVACDAAGRDATRDGTTRNVAARDVAFGVPAGAAALRAMGGALSAKSGPDPELRAGDRRIAVAAEGGGAAGGIVLTVASGGRLSRGRLQPPAAEAWLRRARDLLGRPLPARSVAAKITEEAPLRGDVGGVVLTLARTASPSGRPVYRVHASGAPEDGGPGVVVIADLPEVRARAFVDAVELAARRADVRAR